ELEAAMAKEAAGPRQRLDPTAVEAPVDQLGEVLASGPVAAGERQRRQQRAEARERRTGVATIDGCRGIRIPSTGPLHRFGLLADRRGERRGSLRDRVAEGDHLLGAADGTEVLGDG